MGKPKLLTEDALFPILWNLALGAVLTSEEGRKKAVYCNRYLQNFPLDSLLIGGLGEVAFA